jgi:hypothetical protein
MIDVDLADDGAMDDFWHLDSTSLRWRNVDVASGGINFLPSKRHSMAFAAVSATTIVMYGGMSDGKK